MVDTAFVVPPDKHHRIAEPFAHDPDGGVPMPLMDLRKSTPMQAGGAGLGSTAADYARFLQCMLNGGTLNGARILRPASVRLMTSDHPGDIPVNRSGRAAELLPPGHGFGLGFAVRLKRGWVPSWAAKACTTGAVFPAPCFLWTRRKICLPSC